jgi:hypothetical protein
MTSIAAKQAKRRRQPAVQDASLFGRYVSRWTLLAVFLCWKSCSLATRMEADAIREMHAVEQLSRSLVVSADRTGMITSENVAGRVFLSIIKLLTLMLIPLHSKS